MRAVTGNASRSFCNAISGFESQKGPPSRLRRYGATDFAYRELERSLAGRQGFVHIHDEPRASCDVTELGSQPCTRPKAECWLGGRDSNPDNVVQSHVSYR